MTTKVLPCPRITAADGPRRGVLTLFAIGVMGIACQTRGHRTHAGEIPCTVAAECPASWTCVEGTCCARCPSADSGGGDSQPAGDGDATGADGDGSLPVTVSWNNPCQTDDTVFVLERSSAGGGFAAVSGAPEAHVLTWADQVAVAGTYAYRVLYYCVGPNQNGFLPPKLSPEVALTPASAPRPLTLSITLPTDRSFLAPELEIYRDVNLEHLVYEVSNTLSNPCCTAARKNPCDPTYDESGYWWFANFAGNSYFCQDLPQPKALDPQLTYEAAGGTKTFRTDKHGWAQFTMDTALEEEQGCAITDETGGGKTWLMYATVQSMARVLPSEYPHLRLTQDLKLNRAEFENDCSAASCPGWSETPAIWFMTNETLTAIHPRDGEEGNTLFLTVFPCRTNGVGGCDTIDSPRLIADGTGAYAYIPATDARYQALKPGEWMHYEYDVKDLAEEAIAFFNTTKGTDRTLDEYALTTSGGFHFEAWGGFAIDGEYRGQSLKGMAPAEQCNLLDDDGDGDYDEGCDDDNDHWADAAMYCPNGYKFYSWTFDEAYLTLYPLAQWYPVGDEFWASAGNGWVDRPYPCNTQSHDIDDEDAAVHGELCNLVDDDDDGVLDEGCDDDDDHYADQAMYCPSGFKFFSWTFDEAYLTLYPLVQWYPVGDELWASAGNGWVNRPYPCSSNGLDRDDTDAAIH